MIQKLFDFIEKSPTSYHAVSTVAKTLETAGFKRLEESAEWNVAPGGAYFVTRNLSSVIAFRIPEDDPAGFMIAAAHSDSPAFKIKENAEIKDKNFARLSTEKYGGMLMSTWFDRPLTVAGRIAVKTSDGIECRLVDLHRPFCVIPSVSIHFNRNANDSASFNPAVDTVPLAGIGSEVDVVRAAAEAANVDPADVISCDLFLCNPERGVEYGGAISAPRLDDLECAFSVTEAIISSRPSGAVSVGAIFDNEEVGSMTKQGAASTFLRDTLERIALSLGKRDALCAMLSSSLMASCDNAQGVHPNHPELYDKTNSVMMNGGVVIKYNANQRYATDAVSSALFRVVCAEAGVPVQSYSNRSDLPGGSTLGAIATAAVSVNTVDIGLAQIAMHSSYETAGADDLGYMVKALCTLFSSRVECVRDGKYRIGK